MSFRQFCRAAREGRGRAGAEAITEQQKEALRGVFDSITARPLFAYAFELDG